MPRSLGILLCWYLHCISNCNGKHLVCMCLTMSDCFVEARVLAVSMAQSKGGLMSNHPAIHVQLDKI